MQMAQIQSIHDKLAAVEAPPPVLPPPMPTPVPPEKTKNPAVSITALLNSARTAYDKAQKQQDVTGKKEQYGSTLDFCARVLAIDGANTQAKALQNEAREALRSLITNPNGTPQ